MPSVARKAFCSSVMAAACLSTLAWSGAARASGGPVGEGCWACDLWLAAGANLGASWDADGAAGFLLGGEVSLLDLRDYEDDPAFVPQGAYLDVLHDWRSKTWRLSVGPELVVCPFVGIDGGPVVEFVPDEVRLGGRLRYFVAFPFATPYAGGEYLFDSPTEVVFEVGVLFKVPMGLVRG